MTGENTLERRKHPRIVTMVPVEMKDSGQGKKLKTGIIKGISAGGIGIETYEPFEPGDTIRLSFDLEDDFSFEDISGFVVRIKQGTSFVMGIEFKDVPGDQQARLNEYIKYKMQGETPGHTVAGDNEVVFE